MFCYFCGKENPAGSKFCRYCGKSLITPAGTQKNSTVQGKDTAAGAGGKDTAAGAGGKDAAAPAQGNAAAAGKDVQTNSAAADSAAGTGRQGAARADKTTQSASEKTPQSAPEKTPQGTPDRTPQSASEKTPQSVPDQTPQSAPKKKWLIVLIAVIVIAVIVAAAVFFASKGSAGEEEAKSSQQTQYEQAQTYLLEEDYEEAVTAFTTVIEEEPENTDAYLGRATAFIGLGDEESLEAALTDCRTVIDLDETNTQAYISSSEVYIIRKEYEKARDVLEEGKEKNPESEEIADQIDAVETLIGTACAQAYYDKILELQETYGEAQLERMDETVTYDMGDGYQLYTYYWTGLFFAHLVDMDGDGTEELITGYYDPEKADTSDGYSLLTTGYTIDIWIYADGGIQQGYSLEPSQEGWGDITGYIVCEIGLTDDASYVISEDVSGELTRYEYYGLTDGTVEQIHSFDASSDSITVDGQAYENYEDATAMVIEWQEELTDTQYWYFGGQYVLQEDISYFEAEYEAELAPAEEELESTLAALMESLSTSSDESADASEQQDEGNLPDEAAFAEAVNGENVLYYLAADYDGDGVQEAFGITGDEPDDWGFSNNNSIWFLSSDGTITCVMSDTYGYLSTEDALIEAGDQKFMVWDVSGGSSAVSYIFGVQDGESYQPAISGNYECFRAYDDGYAALTADWSEDWHDYDVNIFEYDGAGEFTLLYTRDYDYDTDTIF